MRDIKNTEHFYKGYKIIGTSYLSSGGYVLGGRHFVEGGLKRTYRIIKDGKYVFHPGDIIETLKYAKELIDDHIIKKNGQEKISRI